MCTGTGDHLVIKYMQEFKDNPTLGNAKNLITYLNRYPDTEILMKPEDYETRLQAWELITGGSV